MASSVLYTDAQPRQALLVNNIITPPFSTWLRFNFPISLYMYCRQTVSSLLNWKPRGQLFTHVSYRLSPRCHQGNEERSRSLERNMCLSVCGMSSSWLSTLNVRSVEGKICLQLSTLWTFAWAVHQRCHPLQ